MQNQGMELLVADDADHEHLFVELYHDGRDWARVTQEQGEPMLEILGGAGSEWVFDLAEVIEILQRARQALSRSSPRSFRSRLGHGHKGSRAGAADGRVLSLAPVASWQSPSAARACSLPNSQRSA